MEFNIKNRRRRTNKAKYKDKTMETLDDVNQGFSMLHGNSGVNKY